MQQQVTYMPRGQICGAVGFVEHKLYDFVLKRSSNRLKVLLIVKTCIKYLSVVQGEKPETFCFSFLSKQSSWGSVGPVCRAEGSRRQSQRVIKVGSYFKMKCTCFLNSSRDGDSATSGKPAPVPNHTFREEIFPDTQPKTPLAHFPQCMATCL